MLLELAGGLGDAFAPHAEHVRDEFLGHGQLVARQSVKRKQQPATQLLVDRVMSIADCGLGLLGDERLGIAQQDVLQLAVTMKFLLEPSARQPVRDSRRFERWRGSSWFHPFMNSAMPIAPSFPTMEISADAPSAITYSSETMESVGK